MSSITGKRMKDRRKELGMSAEIVAKFLGVSPATVYRYERGDIEKLPGTVLGPLSEILRTTPNYLMGWSDNVSDTVVSPSIPAAGNIIPLPKTYTVPLLGLIACGDPILAEQNIIDQVPVPENVKGADFALQCKGDSMIGARIYDGDIVYIRQQPTVDNGQIAAILIDDEATLKRVYCYPGKLVLNPENPAYPPLVYSGPELENIRILGLAVAFLSRVK